MRRGGVRCLSAISAECSLASEVVAYDSFVTNIIAFSFTFFVRQSILLRHFRARPSLPAGFRYFVALAVLVQQL